ncbi:hypothetical protein [Rhizobium sp. AAP43]|uniref:hypothetical protein n=1 Tax=Rhizobium sp. AAP43 TaxID=1523420 RepID=UPI0006B9E07B|nr:hypothetical protein [Rhizobium sp. AAP43]
MTDLGQGPALVADRECGECALCCILPDIDVLDKPANIRCGHCLSGGGCDAYDARPATCRDFFCLWRTDESLSEEWEPSRAHMMLYEQGPQLTVLVDPAFPDAWRQPPYAEALQARAAALKTRGGYVVVFVGDAVTVMAG